MTRARADSRWASRDGYTFYGNEAVDMRPNDDLLGGCGAPLLWKGVAVGAAIGSTGTAVIDNCAFWGNIASATWGGAPSSGTPWEYDLGIVGTIATSPFANLPGTCSPTS